jgi:amino acid transporter
MVIGHFTLHAPGPAALSALILGVVLLAWWPSYHDIKLSTKVMLVSEAVSVLLITVILGAAMVRSHEWVDRAQLHLEGTSFAKYQLGFVLAFMMLSGFESMTALGEEARTATSTLPRAMLLCLLPVALFILACIYVLTSVSHHLNLALDQAAAPLDLIAQSIGHPTLGLLSSLAIAVSCFGCALGGFNAGSRVLFSMARSRQAWSRLGAVHPKNGTPYRALDLLAAIAVVVPVALIYSGVSMADAMDYTLQLATFGFLGGYLAVCVAAPVYLAARAELRAPAILTAVVTVAVLGAVLVMSIVPVPPGADRFLPYIFVGMLATGMVVSRASARRPSGIAPPATEPKAVT